MENSVLLGEDAGGGRRELSEEVVHGQIQLFGPWEPIEELGAVHG